MDGISKVGIFAASLLVAGVAVYVWSPVVGSHADYSGNPTHYEGHVVAVRCIAR